jgi:hypothetical protein
MIGGRIPELSHIPPRVEYYQDLCTGVLGPHTRRNDAR